MGKDINSIKETYTLPSGGKLNGTDGQFTIRSMTTMEEKKRLGNSTLPFKILVDIVNDCIVEPQNFNAYDVPLGDFQFLMHRLRVVTYGKDYPVMLRCPFCSNVIEEIVDLDKLEIMELSEEALENLNITLPRSGDQIKLKLLTPRIIDRIASRSKEILAKSKDYEGSPNYLLTLQEMIEEVNGEKLSNAKLEQYVQKMLSMDSKYLQKEAAKIKLGVETRLEATCKGCGSSFNYDLPITDEFL